MIMKYLIETTNIDYSIEWYDMYDQVCELYPDIEEDSEEFYDMIENEIKTTKASLPQHLRFDVECEEEDLEWFVCEVVSDITGWLNNSVSFKSKVINSKRN